MRKGDVVDNNIDEDDVDGSVISNSSKSFIEIVVDDADDGSKAGGIVVLRIMRPANISTMRFRIVNRVTGWQLNNNIFICILFFSIFFNLEFKRDF